MAGYIVVNFQELARMSLYDKPALDIEKTFRLIQTAEDVQAIGDTPLDEVMKSILRNALPGTCLILLNMISGAFVPQYHKI